MASAQRNFARRVRYSYAVSTISIALVLFLLGGIGYIMFNIFSQTQRMRESVKMIVELKDGLSEAERDTVAVRLAESDLVCSLKFVSKEDKIADEEFRKLFGMDIEGALGTNPLPDSYDVTLSSLSTDVEGVRLFAEEARKIEGVSFVSLPETLLDALHSTLDTLQLVMLLFVSVLLVVSLMLLGNTVQLAIYSQSEMINTLKAVGATRWFIIRPLLARAALQGFVAGVVATLLFGVMLYALDATLPELGILSQVRLIAVIGGSMVVAGIVVATLFTLPTALRFVNMKSNKIHLC